MNDNTTDPIIVNENDINDLSAPAEDGLRRPPVDGGVIAIIDTILSKGVQQLNEDSQRDDWSFIFKAAMADPSGKAFTVDPRDPSTITVDFGYMPVQQLNEDSQRDDWSFIFKAAMADPSGKAFTVDPRDPSTITVDFGYMPDWMTFNVMMTIDDQLIILSLTVPEMQLVSMSQIIDWTQSEDCSYWLSTSDDSQGFDLVGALNDWSSLGMLQFKRTPRIDPSWTISLRFYDGV